MKRQSKTRFSADERLKIGEEAYNNPHIPLADIAIKYNTTAQSVGNYALLYRKINKLPAVRRNKEYLEKKSTEVKYIPPKSSIIVEEENKYEPLTKTQQSYLLTSPNNYYFKKIDKKKEEALERLAKDNGFEMDVRFTYPPNGNKTTPRGVPYKKIPLKPDGYIVHFEKVNK